MVKTYPRLSKTWTVASNMWAAAALVGLAACLAQAEVVTNQFHVHIKGSAEHANPRALADEIAKDNGFHNLGPVSLIKNALALKNPYGVLSNLFFF